jgi:hypothetical protein
MAPPLPSLELYHVGLLVPDMAAAIARHRDVHGTEFSEVRTLRLADAGEVTLAFSRTARPWVELIEMTGDGIYAPSQGEGLHHLGYWTPDVREAVEAFEARGLSTELAVPARGGDGLLLAYFAPGGLLGVRTEVVAESAKPVLDSWVGA